MKLFLFGYILLALGLIVLGLTAINASREMKHWEAMQWQERWEQTPKHDVMREIVEER